MYQRPSILIVSTSASAMPEDGRPTGVWLEELTTPYYTFVDGGADVTLASIAGGAIPIDPASSGADDASVQRYRADPILQQRMRTTPRFDRLDTGAFDALFLPGGHGTMFDYPFDKALATLVETMDRRQKIIGAVCHGPAGLVRARKPDGSAFVAGRRLAAFSDTEEAVVGLSESVPFLLETHLRALGAHYERGTDFAPFAVRDGNLVTGQNPASAGPAARLVMHALRVAAIAEVRA